MNEYLYIIAGGAISDGHVNILDFVALVSGILGISILVIESNNFM